MHGCFSHSTNSIRVNIGTVRLYQRREPGEPFSRGQHREREIMMVVDHIFGAASLPDDDFGRDVLFEVLNQFKLNGATPDELRAHGLDLLPEIDDDDSLDIMVKEIKLGRKRNADDIARRLGVDYQMRTFLDLRTIGACDVPKAARAKIQAQKEAADKRWMREKAGAKPQAQSERRRKEWELQGISESTHRRRKRAAKKAANDTVTALRQSYSSLSSLTKSGHPDTRNREPIHKPSVETEAPASPRSPAHCRATSSPDHQEREAVVSELPAVNAAEVCPERARRQLQAVAAAVACSPDPERWQHLIVSACAVWARAKRERRATMNTAGPRPGACAPW